MHYVRYTLACSQWRIQEFWIGRARLETAPVTQVYSPHPLLPVMKQVIRKNQVELYRIQVQFKQLEKQEHTHAHNNYTKNTHVRNNYTNIKTRIYTCTQYYASIIRTFWSIAANSVITSSSTRLPEMYLSIERIAKFANLSSPIVERK